MHALGGAHSSLGPTACQWQDSESTSAPDASTRISLVDYARADVDEWLQSAPPPAPAAAARAGGGGVQDGASDATGEQWDAECIAALQTIQRQRSCA